MIDFRLRPALASDGEFLADMLVEAFNWSGHHPLGRDEVLAAPDVAHYVAGWPRAGDLGVVAVAGAEPIGAAWLRFFDAADHGYGFVSADVPELSLGVVKGWRRRGVGRALMRELARLAALEGIAKISLSVERANHAAKLYRDEGYRVVAQQDAADTMVKELRG